MDRFKLEYEIKKNGYTMGKICEELGISRSALYRKMRGIADFNQGEISELIRILHLENPMEIFFKNEVS